MTTPDPIRAAASLESAMGELGGDLRSLRTYGRRNRKLIWGLGVSLVVDVALSVGLGVVAVQAKEASDAARDATSVAAQTAQTQQATCLASNDSRTLTIQLWNYVIDAAQQATPPPDAARQQKLTEFRAFVAKTFAQRSC